MATIRKRNGKYQVQVRRKGFRAMSRSFRLLSDAREWAREVERQSDRHELPPDRRCLERITLSDLIIRYRDEVVSTKRNGDTDTFALNLLLRHRISRKSLEALSAGDFAAYRNQRLKTITANSLRRQLNPIRHMFIHAREEWGIPLRENPLSKLKLPATDNRRERRLREGELERITKAADGCRNLLTLPVILFALETAMRRGEILSLRRRDVDLDRGTATIRESKNGYSRTIPLSPAAAVVLAKIRELTTDEEREKSERIFPLSPNALRLSWERLTKRAGIDDLHFHDLRHEAISRFFELGLTVPEVASISGHRDMRMIFRYAHANHASIQAKLNSPE